MEKSANRMRTPRAVRPIQYEYVTIGEVLSALKYELYDTSLDDFIRICMLQSKGHMNPDRAKEIYHTLMNEAGLEPIYGEQ